ncbi:hypothetical protein NDU88_009581 [Pleurodeles waltl]|uniref:Reverse transcriptase RNase H-like domain-containing protein n=1 Tax=Pleurodeles waltl TaxID=8319 RepID=A0AAV7QXY8_PLEWA|nr:hypothetical protein NDU88_009581 [Pleurodeles waltl]
MPLKKRVLLKNKTWALALLDSAAEVTIVPRSLLEHLEVKATDDFIQVETADMRVSDPDRVYTVTLQLEGDIERTINNIFWDCVVKLYDVLLAEQVWPPDFVPDCPVGEEVITPSFSPLVPGELAESYSKSWALAQAPALYRNNVGWDRNSPYHVIPIKGEHQPQQRYPIKFEARASLDPEAVSYVDDIYLTDDELLQNLRRVARIVVGFAEIGYKFNFKKSKIAFLSVIFLGYELSNEGKSLAPHFLEKCAQLQPPNTVRKLQSLLGFLNFGRTYIPDYATRIKQLYELIRPHFSSRFWTNGHTHILRDLQTDLLAVTHLHTRDNKTHLVIRVIPGAVGFTYVTFNEGDTVPIAYKSHLYSAAEQRFAQTEKILTAVQMAVIKERPLAQGQRIVVVSPIPALEAVTKASVPNSKALHPRWIQWATSLTATDVDYIFDPKLQTQEFLQYEMEYPVPAGTLPIDQYQVVMYTDGSAQQAVGTK